MSERGRQNTRAPWPPRWTRCRHVGAASQPEESRPLGSGDRDHLRAEPPAQPPAAVLFDDISGSTTSTRVARSAIQLADSVVIGAGINGASEGNGWRELRSSSSVLA